ncbi:MAG TPA: BadF/BadG/BcrA/BcrD ATPase family protein [Solirubrobacteraceae bacterium]|nr:BadF/BadG/BcrA/BcrD ATPase family protein [Solirubrobacteraceae bacterium]
MRDSLVQLPRVLQPAHGREARISEIGHTADGVARFVMGVDGGATKTLAAVLDLEHSRLHLGRGGPSNPDAAGAQAASRAVLDACAQAIEGAGITDSDVVSAVLAIAGTDTAAVAREVETGHPDGWIVVNDVVAAWSTATGAQPGVGVISGTGSNVFGVGPRGRPWRVGGWGHVLGDEGSGYWFGVQAIKAALRDREASGPETALSDAAVEFFAVANVEELGALVYAKPLTKGEIAAFAVQIAKVAEQGDAVARELFERGARELGAQIVAVIRQTELGGPFPVGLIGSAFKAGPMFVEPLTDVVRAAAPQARLAVVEMAPVGGSLMLAARAAGCEARIDPAGLTKLLDAQLTDQSTDAAK